MQNLLAFLAIMAVPAVFIVLVLRQAWRARQGPAGSDSGDGAISDWGAGGDGDGGGAD